MSERFSGMLCVGSLITITSACAGRGATSSPTCADGDELECEGSASAQPRKLRPMRGGNVYSSHRNRKRSAGLLCGVISGRHRRLFT
jgi:hypothetical protein